MIKDLMIPNLKMKTAIKLKKYYLHGKLFLKTEKTKRTKEKKNSAENVLKDFIFIY